MKNTIIAATVSALIVSLLFITYQTFNPNVSPVVIERQATTKLKPNTLFTTDTDGNIDELDFSEVAANVKNSVVHVRTSAKNNFQGRGGSDPFRDFFGDEFFRRFQPDQEQEEQRPSDEIVPRGSGSGVIISADGYIVTNNHVVDDADKIEITLLNNETFEASVIGTDPNTDLAVVKIEADDLPTLPFVDSDNTKVGQWVMAVGNPFNLTSTVTAGIISAKGRNINILRSRYAVESFIQTDAAINPGNSGGALVDLDGGLVGINTAIASPTGSYAGYGFAIPSNLVQKIVEDLITYGAVQRGYLGAFIRDVNADFAEERDLATNSGVYIDSLTDQSAAAESGVLQGDVVKAVDGIKVTNRSELIELVARKRPGESVNLQIDRSGEIIDLAVNLKNRAGNREIVKKAEEEYAVFQRLGIEVEELSDAEKKEYEIENGVIVRNIVPGKISRSTTMREEFVITHVDGVAVKSVKSLNKILEGKTGGVMIEGYYAGNEEKSYYAIGLG